MDARLIQNQLVADTLESEARINTVRAYLGMSRIADCLLAQYREYFRPRTRPTSDRLKFALGYAVEDMMRAGLVRLGLYVPDSEKIEIVTPFDVRCKGHPDGLLLYRGEYALLEIKKTVSVELTKVLQQGVSYRHFQQVQCYMRYLVYPVVVREAILVYKASDNGRIGVVRVARDDNAGQVIEERIKTILAAIDAQKPPQCTCGYCPLGER